MPERLVDLRSDTVTQPTEEMRQAMARAPLGDDCYGDDPTVNRLQDLAAERLGTEAALFVPSGTMGNTCALLAHTRPGDEVILESMSHIYGWECGNYAAVAGLAVRLVQGDEGIVPAERLEAAIRAPNVHYAPARLACLENTHNNACGSAWTPAEVEAFAAAARRHGLAVHLDGARVFNAAVALGVDVRQYARCVDSVMFCVSKGLSAPVGSLLCGSRAFVDRASGMRKRLGGAMRQAGVIAAAGIVALERMVDRLAVDHAHCRALATGLAAIPGLEVLQAARPTNILQLDVSALGWRAAELIDRWVPYGIRCNPRPPTRVRLVTHRHIDDADVEYVLAVTRRLVTAA